MTDSILTRKRREELENQIVNKWNCHHVNRCFCGIEIAINLTETATITALLKRVVEYKGSASASNKIGMVLAKDDEFANQRENLTRSQTIEAMVKKLRFNASCGTCEKYASSKCVKEKHEISLPWKFVEDLKSRIADKGKE